MTLWSSPFSPAEAKSLLQNSPSQSHTWIVWMVMGMMVMVTMATMVISPPHPPWSRSCSAYWPGPTPKSSHAASLHCHLQPSLINNNDDCHEDKMVRVFSFFIQLLWYRNILIGTLIIMIIITNLLIISLSFKFTFCDETSKIVRLRTGFQLARVLVRTFSFGFTGKDWF